MNMKINKAVISGGGTGGHIFPAIAIADELKSRNPNIDILFIGANGKMEMEKVPEAGYRIVGLDIRGLQRKLTLSNFALPFRIIKSLLKARKTIKEFNPDVAIGVGGYASGPALKAATMLGIPSLLQEQNSFAGKTNKILAKKVQKICVAYDQMERFFPSEKIVLTGNPTREKMVDIKGKAEEAYSFFGLNPNKKTILIIGGSLGAKTLNESMKLGYEELDKNGYQVLWQCGKIYHDNLCNEISDQLPESVKLMMFIQRMDLAYSCADIIISRAGAISVSELCIIGKPTVLVPSPNVAEDHQTKNAMALVNKNAAVLVKDVDAKESLIQETLSLLNDTDRINELRNNIQALATPNATAHIVDIIETIVK